MGRFIGGILDNDSTFGRIMTRLAIIIGANLTFVIFAIPVITIIPGLVALFYVMLKTLHSDDSLNPFKTFWKGFRMNLKQGIICELGIAVLAFILVQDIRFSSYQGGILTVFKYPCYALLFFLIVETIYLLPTMAAFEDRIPNLLRNAFFFAARRPLKMLLAAAIMVIPVAVTIIDTSLRPLYGFLWVVLGFGLLTMMVSELLYKDIEEYLPKEEGEEELPEERDTDNSRKSKRQILREMKKLDKK